MVLLYSFTALGVTVVVVLCSVGWSCAEKRLLCSLESGGIWYDYEGPIYHFTASVSPCYFGMRQTNVQYSVITMFTIKRAGYHLSILYKNKQWLEFSEPVGSCSGLKMCHIIKGESFQESFPVHLKVFSRMELTGEYLALLRINIVDDFEREFTVNVTINVYLNGR
ncbi:hypothetical protein SRHO_G00245960 [Serrasalmus rhombeus]